MVITFVFSITSSPSLSLCYTSLKKRTEMLRLKWNLHANVRSSKSNLDVKGRLFVVTRCRGEVDCLYTHDANFTMEQELVDADGLNTYSDCFRGKKNHAALYKVELQMFSFLWASLFLPPRFLSLSSSLPTCNIIYNQMCRAASEEIL